MKKEMLSAFSDFSNPTDELWEWQHQRLRHGDIKPFKELFVGQQDSVAKMSEDMSEAGEWKKILTLLGHLS